MSQLFSSEKTSNAYFKVIAHFSVFTESELLNYVGEQTQLYAEHPAYPSGTNFPSSQLPLDGSSTFAVGLPWKGGLTDDELYFHVGKNLAGDAFAQHVSVDSNSFYETRFLDVLKAVENQVNLVATQQIMRVIQQVYIERGISQLPILPNQTQPEYVNPATHRLVLSNILENLSSVFSTLTIDDDENNIVAMIAAEKNSDLVDVIVSSVLKA